MDLDAGAADLAVGCEETAPEELGEVMLEAPAFEEEGGGEAPMAPGQPGLEPEAPEGAFEATAAWKAALSRAAGSVSDAAREASATFCRSPVSSTLCFTPRRFSAAMASGASGFSWSLMTMCPRYSLPRAMCTTVPGRWHSCQSAPTCAISLPLPT